MSQEKKENTCENKKSKPEILSDKSKANDEMPEQTAREIRIHYKDSPVPQRNREVHPRQKIPLVPEADENVFDNTPSPPVEID